MNVGESCDVNTIALWILGLSRGGETVSDEQAREALARLVDHAHAKLMAGPTAKLVREHWQYRTKGTTLDRLDNPPRQDA